SIRPIAAKSRRLCPVGTQGAMPAPSRDETGGRFMRHASTQAVFAHWNERRRHRPAPERAEIDPVEIRHALGDTFILASDFVDQLRFRLAGTKVCALFCRELKGEAFGELWGEESRESVEHLITVVNNENIGAVA